MTRRNLLILAVLAGVVPACASSPAPPGPGESRGIVPELREQRVLVLPFQLREGVSGDPDAEFAFVLTGTAGAVDWIFPDEIREALRASPALDAPLTGLPVDVFLRAEVDRLGDPVFGVLRRLGALTGADVALLPVAVFAVPATEGRAAEIRASAALMSVRDGRVLWYGMEAGEGTGGDPAALARVMDRLGRTIVPTRTLGPGQPGGSR